MRVMMQAADHGESALAARMREHLGQEPKELPSTTADFAPTEHPNVQLGLEAVLPDAEVLGYSTGGHGFMAPGLSGLISGRAMGGPVDLGPVQYKDVDLGDGRVVRCVSAGLYLAQRDGAPVALVVSSAERPYGDAVLRLEAISPHDGTTADLFRDLRLAMRERNVYRGRVISLHSSGNASVSVKFHQLPDIDRQAVILPAGTLE